MNNDIVPGFDDEKSQSLTMRLQKIEGVEGGLIVHASGYIDTSNTLSFEKSIGKAIEAGFVRIAFEMSRVDYLSSHPIGVLAQLLRTVRFRDGDLVLNNVRPKVSEVLHLLGLSRFFTFTEDLRESVAHLSAHPALPAFPKFFNCPICARRLKASGPGRFRCVECKAILVIDGKTNVMTGREKEALHGTQADP